MRSWPIVFVCSLAAQSASGWAQTKSSLPVTTTRQLSGLRPEEATALLAKLKDAQQRLTGGEFQSFELLAGSIASYDQAKISARQAFLQVAFEKVWSVEKVPSDNPLWQPYRLAYAPDGLGRPYWYIEVVLGINGNIQRVLMVYKPPAPF